MNQEKPDYRDTLCLPKTSFPMKADLAKKELEILNFWNEKQIYKKMTEKNSGRDSFILHDGPPYANGNIHIGHALNKILKDIIVKSKNMLGFESRFIPGWDCHGLPIELQVDKALANKKRGISKIEFRKECREYARKYVNIQSDEFRRLGVLGEWENPYLTMSPVYEAGIVGEFLKMAEKGYVYRRKKPVYWCIHCETALAEAEVEYDEHSSPSIYVAFPYLEAGKSIPELKNKNTSIVIWTTTPWTIPANLAIALHPDLEYSAVETEKGGRVIILAKELIERVMKELSAEKYEIIASFSGKKLAGTEEHAKHPIYERDSKLVLAGYVSKEDGTGCVHTAPGHGEDDYKTGRAYNLEILSPVDSRGRFTQEAPFFEGENVFKANQKVIEKLKETGALLKESSITHSYPHCWRCKKPVIFRATEQWFISVEKENLREKSLREIEKVNWIPPWGRNRIEGMMKSRPDWCISRQRAWGVPIIAIYCAKCETPVPFSTILKSKEKLLSKFAKNGTDAWFELQPEEILPVNTICQKCGNPAFKKEEDILDVWFDSGVSHAVVLENTPGLRWPADLYLEGSDQHRGWFHTSLLHSTATRGSAPYTSVLTHGFTVDGNGKKMSKSLGNVIAPQEVIKKHGAEILRLWVSAEDYRDDVRISDEIIVRLVEAYRKIRNTLRFLIANIYDFDVEKEYVKKDNLLEIDRFILHRLQELTETVTKAYTNYLFHEVYHLVYNFCVVDLSSFYLDILKDRMYTFRNNSLERKSGQTVFSIILEAITKLIAPVLSFTAEEIWQSIPYKKGAESVFLANLPEVDKKYIDTELAKRWNKLLDIRKVVLKGLEIKRKEQFIGSALEACVEIEATGDIKDILAQYADYLPTIFIVSETKLTPVAENESLKDESIPGLKIKITRASGRKCERCWNYKTDVGKNPEHPSLCSRCVEAIS
ncbi:MAG TPA: isoleucine--tRNA ligase [bacterium]